MGFNKLSYFVTFISTYLMLGYSPVMAQLLTADKIMEKSHNRYTGDTRISDSILTLIDKRDRRRVRSLRMYAIENKEIKKTIMYFLSPSDVKGTAYMSFDWEDRSKEDDSWLYLPALQKVKRMSDSEKSGSFMGSDFSYADINGLDYEDFNYTMVKESELVDEFDCWVIKLIPKNDEVIDRTGYASSTVWVRKDSYIQVRGIISVKKGKKVKYFTATDIVDIDGIWTAKVLQMITTKGGEKQHASVISFENIKYNKDIDDSMFDTRAMQRGI